MAKLIYLNRVRKKARKAQQEANAALRRQMHGRSKAERAIEQARRAKLERDLDKHRIETGEQQ